MESFIKIPNKVKADRELSRFAKVLYWEILSLSSKGICEEPAEYFISSLNISRTALYRGIKLLREKWFIVGAIWQKKWRIALVENANPEIRTTVPESGLQSQNRDYSTENGTTNSKNLDWKRKKNESTLYYNNIYNIIYNILDKLLERKSIKERPSENLIQAFKDFYEYRVQASKNDKKMLITELSLEKVIKSMCNEKYEAIAIRKIERAIENWRRWVNYDLDPKEADKIIQKEKQKSLSTPTTDPEWLRDKRKLVR